MRSARLEALLVLGVVAAPLLPPPYSALALLLLTVVWSLIVGARQLGVAGLLLLAAVALSAGGWMWSQARRSSTAAWRDGVRREYSRFVEQLRQEAREAVRELPVPSGESLESLRGREARLEAFRRLARLAPREGPGRRALLLIDPDDVPAAWAGEGLLHELPDGLPRSGLVSRSGYSAVTLLAVEPLTQARRTWRVLSGASFSTASLPFAPGGAAPVRWSLVEPGVRLPPGAVAVELRDGPRLALERAGEAGALLAQTFPVRFTWLPIGLALVWLSIVRGLPRLVPGAEPPAAPHAGVYFPVLGGLTALGAAAAVPAFALCALAFGVALSALGLSGPRWRLGRTAVLVQGVGICAFLFGAAWAAQRLWGPLDLAPGILASPLGIALRLAFAAAAFGLLGAATVRAEAAPRGRRAERWAWLAVALLLAAGASSDRLAVALPLLAAGSAAAILGGAARRRGAAKGQLVLVVIACLAAAGAWEAAYRLRLRGFAGHDELLRLAPPTPRQMAALDAEIQRHFGATDLTALVPVPPHSLDRQDLAYALWRDSPLARPSALSALYIQPEDGGRSLFAFGIPLTETQEGEPRILPSPWQDLSLPLWEETTLSGRFTLHFEGKPWARARYWLIPRPGFEPAGPRRLAEVEPGLLRGAPAADVVGGAPGQVLDALYSATGRAVLSPWEEEPPLPRPLRQASARTSAAVVDTPDGKARAWAKAARDGWQVTFLPILSPTQSLERAGRFTVGTLLLLVLTAPAVLLLALPRAAFRNLAVRALRSYSQRLVIVFTLLLLLPLLLLNVVLLRVIEERLEGDQRAAGEGALASAQQLLGEDLLTLPPGFGVDTGFGDQLLRDLAAKIRHEINLYWGSGIYASSQHELFTAGLLPKRIPGEVYSRLALLGYGFASRINRVGGTNYLEMYAPLRVPGVETGQERVFILSVPLLAQQEEGTRQLAQLREQAYLVTAGLFALLVAVGGGLAGTFTRPLMELVEGTHRIAAGARSLELTPSELELAALVEAIDDMARRIALGRESLLREKQVVERMVDNITAGVVSLDRDRRVLLHNRVAADLLGSEVGERLDEAVGRSERLAPVATFLAFAGGEMARRTVKLPAAEGGDDREWSLVWVPLPGQGEPAALLVVEDSTEELRSQRLQAWAEMARIIAHEIKNPLTPIRLSAEHMQEVYRHDPDQFGRVFERCTQNILTQVEELRSIASDFSIYSSIPRIEPRPGDIVATMAELVEGYRAAPPAGVSIELLAGVEALPARFDAKLLHRAVRNLIENALRVSAGGGRVSVKVDRDDGMARIAVLDSGPGVAPDILQSIFDPYFSTHDSGTGLGLPIARRIAEEHGGEITARNRPGGGLEVAITLPV